MWALAILPTIILLFYIYKKDKREKEPIGILLGCFGLGILSIIPAVIMEGIIEEVVGVFCIEGSIAYAIMEGFVVAGFSEELCKYLFLKLRTWKSKEFNCTFDGIVYAVFVSVGFATLENIFYVMDGGLSTAILRFFTAVPGHACDAVFMGYFYSKAKKAYVDNDKKEMRKNKRRALWVPILSHGIYDCLISFDAEVVGDTVVGLGVLLWLVVVIALFVMAFITVNKASKTDIYLIAADQVLAAQIPSGDVNATTNVYGNAMSNSNGNAMANANGNAAVNITGNAMANANGNAAVNTTGNAIANANGNVAVNTTGNAMANTNGNINTNSNVTVNTNANANAPFFISQSDGFALKPGNWICSCRTINNGKFCVNCGTHFSNVIDK